MWGVGESYIDSLYQTNEERLEMISSEVREAMELWEANGRKMEGLGSLVQVRVEQELSRRSKEMNILNKFWEEWTDPRVAEVENVVEELERRVAGLEEKLQKARNNLLVVKEAAQEVDVLREKWYGIEAADVDKDDLEKVLKVSRKIKKALR